MIITYIKHWIFGTALPGEVTIEVNETKIQNYPAPIRNMLRYWASDMYGVELRDLLAEWGGRIVDTKNYEDPITFVFKSQEHYDRFSKHFSGLYSR